MLRTPKSKFLRSAALLAVLDHMFNKITLDFDMIQSVSFALESLALTFGSLQPVMAGRFVSRFLVRS